MGLHNPLRNSGAHHVEGGVVRVAGLLQPGVMY